MKSAGSLVLVIAFIIMSVFGVAWIAGDAHMSIYPCPLGIAAANACPSTEGFALLFHHLAGAKNVIASALLAQLNVLMIALVAVGMISMPYIRQASTVSLIRKKEDNSSERRKMLRWFALQHQGSVPHTGAWAYTLP